MPTYIVNVNWSGYSRGVAAYSVEADSEEEARDNYFNGEELFRKVVRDDIGSDVEEVYIGSES